MLRITDRMSNLTSQRDLSRAQYDLAVRQREASSGIRVQRPSDDPAASTSLVRLHGEQHELGQCQTNTDRAVGTLQASDQLLDSMSNLLVRARELATAAASDHYSANERSIAAQEVSALRDQLIALANTQQDGEYILGGYATGTAPVDGTGAVVGDNNTRMILAAPGLEVAASISAQEALDPTSGQNVISALETLALDLTNNDVAGVRTAVGTLGECHEQVTDTRALAGVRLATIYDLQQINESRTFDVTVQQANLAEVDAVESLAELARAQKAVEGALQVTARVLSSLSLVDKL